MPRHVILGAGPAGLNAIETIRQIDTAATIVLVSQEPAYARMALPYFISREIPEEHLATASDDYFARLRVERRIGRRAVQIDLRAAQVALDDGEAIGFHSALIATGSAPLRPPIPGADGPHVHNLWTLDETKQMLASARRKKPAAVVVGGGFIGLIALSALNKIGWKLMVVESEGHILPGMLDRRGAEAAEAWLRARGVQVYTGCSVAQIGGSRKKTVALSDGQSLESDVVILSTGIRPNVDFLAGTGIALDGGIVIDRHCQTNAPGIYAAGDVAAGPDLLGGGTAVHAIQSTAVDHGRVAGANMAGHETTYPGSLVMNILDLAGLHCASFGRWQGDGDVTRVWAPARPVYRKLVWEGSRLAGGIVVGPVEDTTMLTDVGMLKGLIQARVELGDWKKYLNERPWDLRRAYVASRAAERLLPYTATGAPARARGYTFAGLSPRNDPGPHHADLVRSRPGELDSLPPTPTPGIYKTPPGESGKPRLENPGRPRNESHAAPVSQRK